MDTVIPINPFEVPAEEEALRFWEQVADYIRKQRQHGIEPQRVMIVHEPISLAHAFHRRAQPA